MQVAEGSRSQGLAVEETVRLFVRNAREVLGSIDLGLTPMVFLLTRHVMLEMPALAFVLAAIYHFVRSPRSWSAERSGEP